MLLNCGVGEDGKEIKPVNFKGNMSWIFIGRTDAEAETPVLWPSDVKNWKKHWCWESLKAGRERDNRGWDGWMASLTRWTWVWVSSGSWWWTGRPGVLQPVGLQRVGPYWVTELNWTEGAGDCFNRLRIGPCTLWLSHLVKRGCAKIGKEFGVSALTHTRRVPSQSKAANIL